MGWDGAPFILGTILGTTAVGTDGTVHGIIADGTLHGMVDSAGIARGTIVVGTHHGIMVDGTIHGTTVMDTVTAMVVDITTVSTMDITAA